MTYCGSFQRNIVSMIFITLGILCSVHAIKNEVSPDSLERISIEDGIFIEHKGYIYMASEASPTTMISVLVKLPNLYQDFNIPMDKKNYCLLTSLDKDIDGFLTYRDKLHIENDNFITQRLAILQDYIAKRRQKGRY